MLVKQFSALFFLALGYLNYLFQYRSDWLNLESHNSHGLKDEKDKKDSVSKKPNPIEKRMRILSFKVTNKNKVSIFKINNKNFIQKILSFIKTELSKIAVFAIFELIWFGCWNNL